MEAARDVSTAGPSDRYAAKTEGMPIVSATERAAICSAVAATIMSQPCAAAVIVSNWVATVPSAS